ncbi:MAG: SURF1 family protein [Pseudomonadota bacterium]
MRRLAFLLICGLGGAAILISLGVWQVQRLAWKEGILAQIETRIAADPVALPADLDTEVDEYLPVMAAGMISPESLRVLVSQKQIGAGYRLIHAVQLVEGPRILVDRGFIRTSATPAVPPNGPLRLTGNLHWPDEVDGYTPTPDLDENIWFARDVSAMAETLETAPILLVLREESFVGENVTPLPVDTGNIPNDHLQYAITWFSLAVVWLGMTVYFIRRSPRRSGPERAA